MTGERITDLFDPPLMPVLTVQRLESAVPLADALMCGGLSCVEITFRTAIAGDALARVAQETSAIVGAGTVLTVEQARRAIDAGAQFIVSPGLDLEVLAYCAQREVPAIPGIATATELQTAVRAGADVVKFFPAEALGGPPMLRALTSPFPDVRFIPTGGVDGRNAGGYLNLPSVLAVAGSWMTPSRLVEDCDWDAISVRAAEAVDMARDAGR